MRFLAVNDLRTYAGGGGSREHHDELRARGLAVARGAVVALIEDHGDRGAGLERRAWWRRMPAAVRGAGRRH